MEYKVLNIKKRNGEIAAYNSDKIKIAVSKAFEDCEKTYSDELLKNIVADVEATLSTADQSTPTVEQIQDAVETSLMRAGYFDVAKRYILYRQKRTEQRKVRMIFSDLLPGVPNVEAVLLEIEKDFGADACHTELLAQKFMSFKKEGMSQTELLSALVKAACELTTNESPSWELVAARLLYLKFKIELDARLAGKGIDCLYDKLRYLTELGLYGAYILESYSKEEIAEAEAMIDEDRCKLFNYSGLELLLGRYVVHGHDLKPLETPQEMFIGIALHLAINEGADRMKWVERFYYMLSTLKVSMATPTLSNARKPFHQLSSCFIDTVPDSLDGIFRSIDSFAKVSKFGGGMGMYLGKVRAKGSDIRGFKGAAGGVIRWIKLINDTAVAVDQLGMRQGAVAVYLDAWHKDLPEFLALRTNNGDDRMKAHDVFPAVCYPDMFWRMCKEDLNATWYLMCPHEIRSAMGYSLEDYYGREWERRYNECINDERISKRPIILKELVRLIIRSAAETGTPFVFNRDTVNRANPNSHSGIIYCSNLCTEIAQNMSEIHSVSQTIQTEDGEQTVVVTTRPGDFVVCNLASLTLGRINVDDENELRDIIESAVRALDNVIDLNFYPVPYAEITNKQYRPIGLGVSGYHHMLAKHRIRWESEEHLEFVDRLFERINYYTISASMKNAKEKGSYARFEGSQWQTGEYFERRSYLSEQWQALAEEVAEHGLRNGYLLAVAPTSSTSIITGTTAGIDPIMSKFFLEEKKNGLLPRVAPELSIDTQWYYKNAHSIDQTWSIRACGIRSRHIDQAQSQNIYITTEISFSQILALYIRAHEEGVKTLYYVRSKSLEMDAACDSCTA